MAGWLTSMLRAKGPSTKISGNEDMTVCRWLLSITILQLPQDKTEGAQSALIKWQFTRCKYLRIWDEHFIRRPRRAPPEFERRHRIISVFFGFDPEFVEERSLHLFCFGWLPVMSAVAQCRSPSSAAFPRLLHASAFSLLPLCKDTTKGSTMCTANKNKPACSDPWRSDSQTCSVTKALQQRSLEMRTWQYVDDHYPSPSCSCHRTRLKAHKAPL